MGRKSVLIAGGLPMPVLTVPARFLASAVQADWDTLLCGICDAPMLHGLPARAVKNGIIDKALVLCGECKMVNRPPVTYAIRIDAGATPRSRTSASSVPKRAAASARAGRLS
jgi:hypothetical protein